jgi:serine/threonine protein kinase
MCGKIEFHDAFAVKRLRTNVANDQKKSFEKEVEMLKRFSGAFSEHLIRLLMTWDIGGRHYFLFPMAGYDLDRYWEDESKKIFVDPNTNQMHIDDATWISWQILGLTNALHIIHNPSHLNLAPEEQKYGRHGDLKAENILFYRSRKYPKGIFVIADFGLCAFNTDQSRSNVPGGSSPYDTRIPPA